jgi:phosphatidate cytidylyltransferase
MAPKLHSFLIRTATAVVALPAVLLLIWHPVLDGTFTLFVTFLAAMGLFEYYAIVRKRRISPETIGGIIIGTLVTLSGHLNDLMVLNLMLYGGCLLVAALHIVRGQHSVAGIASSAFGVFYIGWFAAHILLIHQTPGVGPSLVTLLLVVVILTDAAAYLVGSLVGRHKLAPAVSPNKTWEGAVAGFVAALLGVLALYWLREPLHFTGLPDWGVWNYLKAGALLSLVGQIGDLTESCLKRDAGVKDSGGMFPGHGGVLDRCDGFLFATPALYYIYVSLALE